MAANTGTSPYVLSQMREDIKRTFQAVRVKLNQREQELLKRVSALELELKSHSDSVSSDLAKLRRTQRLLEETLDSRELASTQQTTLKLIREKISGLDRSRSEFKCGVSLVLDTGPLEALIPALGEFSDAKREEPASPPSPLMERRPRFRSHTPDPFTEPLQRRANRFSFSPSSDTSHFSSSFSEPHDSLSISEEPHGYSTPQPGRKVSGRVAKFGRSRK